MLPLALKAFSCFGGKDNGFHPITLAFFLALQMLIFKAGGLQIRQNWSSKLIETTKAIFQGKTVFVEGKYILILVASYSHNIVFVITAILVSVFNIQFDCVGCYVLPVNVVVATLWVFGRREFQFTAFLDDGFHGHGE
jgi:hypothetical protein